MDVDNSKEVVVEDMEVDDNGESMQDDDVKKDLVNNSNYVKGKFKFKYGDHYKNVAENVECSFRKLNKEHELHSLNHESNDVNSHKTSEEEANSIAVTHTIKNGNIENRDILSITNCDKKTVTLYNFIDDKPKIVNYDLDDGLCTGTSDSLIRQQVDDILSDAIKAININNEEVTPNENGKENIFQQAQRQNTLSIEDNKNLKLENKQENLCHTNTSKEQTNSLTKTFFVKQNENETEDPTTNNHADTPFHASKLFKESKHAMDKKDNIEKQQNHIKFSSELGLSENTRESSNREHSNKPSKMFLHENNVDDKTCLESSKIHVSPVDIRKVETNLKGNGPKNCNSDYQYFTDDSSSSDKEFYEGYLSIDEDSTCNEMSEEVLVPTFKYTKLDWTSFIQSMRKLPDWEFDDGCSIERALVRSSFGDGEEKNFYRDFTAFDHIENGDIRGWNEGELVYIAEIIPISKDKDLGEYHTGLPIGTNVCESDLSHTGARPKIFKVQLGNKSSTGKWQHSSKSCELNDLTSNAESSYVRNSKSSPENLIDKPNEVINPYLIIDYLMRQDNHRSDLKTIQEEFRASEDVKNCILDNCNVFGVTDNWVQLSPKISFCSDYMTSRGCPDKSICHGLHVCDEYIMHSCREMDCMRGHKIHTTHNSRILSKFYMENLDSFLILNILQNIIPECRNLENLDICQSYNFSKCENKKCKNLHICNDYLGGLGTCVRPQCVLNHDLNQEICLNVLKYYGIKMNGSSEEILIDIIHSSSKLCQLVQNYDVQLATTELSSLKQGTAFARKGNSESKLNKDEYKVSKDRYSDLTPTMDSKTKSTETQNGNSQNNAVSNASNSQKTQKTLDNSIQSPSSSLKTTPQKRETPWKDALTNSFKKITSLVGSQSNPSQKSSVHFGTVWSTYPRGDVEIPELCYYALNGVCRFESSGCKRLHGTRPYHWQFKPSGNVNWINLQEKQVFDLEQNYCNPYIDSAALIPGDAKLKPNIVPVLLNTDKWFADFNDMKLINESHTEILQLRRISVHSYIEEKIGNFTWYFIDNNADWIEYGIVHTYVTSDYAVKVTSAEIEKQYQRGKQKIHFQNVSKSFRYRIDFVTMTQENVDTGKKRKVKRRPKALHSNT